MSRRIKQAIERPETEKQQREQEKGKVLITAVPPGLGERQEKDEFPEPLMAVWLRQDRLAAVQTFSLERQSRIGAIYLGKVRKSVKNLNACFVEIADREQCFLPLGKIKGSPFLTNRSYDGRILEGDELLVQIEQDAIKTKQAVVTTRISLRGEYFVFSTGEARVGISRKLNEKQRKELYRLLTDWGVTAPSAILIQRESLPSFGLVIRTQAGRLLEQAAGRNQEETQSAVNVLHQEYEQLYGLFSALFLQGRYRTCFTCLHQAGTALEETMASFRTEEYEEVVTDLPQVYEELRELQGKKPSLAGKKLRFYQDDGFSLSQLYSLKTRLEEALRKTVWLKSGANLVIEQTESLTAIDVNTGKSLVQLGGKSPEETMRRVNLEAAREVARQLRLRNLSGIIIVDFINLASLQQQEELLENLRELVKEDPITVQVVDMTGLGLVEMTRKKVKPSLLEQFGRCRNRKEQKGMVWGYEAFENGEGQEWEISEKL